MKVRELTAKVNLISGQNIKLVDHSTCKTFITKERYAFDLGSDEIERLLKLKVNSFTVCNTGITIHAG